MITVRTTPPGQISIILSVVKTFDEFVPTTMAGQHIA